MRCFVIQPFNPKYDKRFEDVFEPAVKAAGYEPYRVDRDPKVSVPIDEIESQIKSAAACLIDISEDNPNVWFELGFALAYQKQLCIVCSRERQTPFPFDIQHRKIIRYQTESSRDFTELREKIRERLEAVSEQAKQELVVGVGQAQVVDRKDGFDYYDLSCLGLLAAEASGLDDTVSHNRIRDAMERAGMTAVATAMSLHSLRQMGLIEPRVEDDFNGESYHTYAILKSGWDVLLENRDDIALHRLKKAQKKPRESFNQDLDDEIPF